MGERVGGMGGVYATLVKVDIASYLPYVATGLVFWGLIATALTESCSAFIDNEAIIKQVALGRFTYILRMMARNLIVLMHNAIIIVIVLVIIQVPQSWALLMLIPGMLLVIVNLGWIGYVLAIIGARFRDIPQIVQSAVQILFFVSPVIFRPSQLPANHPVILFNPIAWMLEVLREPMLGVWPSAFAYTALIVMMVVGWAFALVFAGRYAQRVVYWL
jgi:ABC-type polysaccharide/polyol phosphate export permease